MSRPTRRSCLATLTRARLWELAQEHEVDASSRDKRDALLDALVQARRFKLANILESMRRDELKAACRAHELDDGGRRNDVIRARIMAAAGQAPTESSNRQGDLFESVGRTGKPGMTARAGTRTRRSGRTSGKGAVHVGASRRAWMRATSATSS